MRVLRSLVVPVLVWLGARSGRAQQPAERAAAPSEQEASAGFDAEDVEPFLLRLPPLVDSGLTAADVHVLARRILAQPLDSERSYVSAVIYHGTRVSLRIVAFMDDVDAPDIAFFTVPDFAEEISRELDTYFESVGK